MTKTVDGTAFITGYALYASSPNETLRRNAPYVEGTVGEELAKPGVLAQAQLGGHDIYIDPSKFKASDFY